MTTTPCPVCPCSSDAPAHAIAGALAIDDLDRALALGLLEGGACPHCSQACRDRLEQARHARLAALAARERYRARQSRLARRAAERAALRGGSIAAAGGADATEAPASAAGALPPAAAAALARALARAARKPR
jgi:hypothetical protein